MYQTALELGEQLLTLAQRQPDPSLLLLAHNVLADTLLMRGEFRAAHEHLERAEALYDIHRHRSPALVYGYDSGIHCLSFAAWALWLLGYPDQALKKIYAALSLAQELSHPFTFVFALLHVIILHHLRREAHVAPERAEAEIALCTEQGFAVFLAGGSIYRGWALIEQGQGKEGIAQIRQGLAAWQATRTEMGRPYFLALLAKVYGEMGEPEQGLAALVEALALVEQTGERWYEAELYRIKGELTLQQQCKVQSSECKVPSTQHPAPRTPAEVEAEACFHKAVEIAQKQQAKSLELRATVSLARLWQQQGKRKQAHKMLAEIYGWFTEGFDTKDLQEARALLDSLEAMVKTRSTSMS